MICFLHCQSRYEIQIFSQFSKSLTHNNCECGKFYSTRGRDDRRAQAGNLSGQATPEGGPLPPPGVPHWPISGVPFTISLCSLSLFVPSQLFSKDRILLHFAQTNLAIVFCCTLHSCFLIHAFSSHCLPQMVYLKWLIFLVKGSSFFKIMSFQSYYDCFTHSFIQQIFIEVCAVLTTRLGMVNTEVKRMGSLIL